MQLLVAFDTALRLASNTPRARIGPAESEGFPMFSVDGLAADLPFGSSRPCSYILPMYQRSRASSDFED